MIILWFSYGLGAFPGYDFDAATRQSTAPAKQQTRLQVRKPYQKPSKHIKASPGEAGDVSKSYQNRNEIVSKSYPNLEIIQHRIEIVNITIQGNACLPRHTHAGRTRRR